MALVISQAHFPPCPGKMLELRKDFGGLAAAGPLVGLLLRWFLYKQVVFAQQRQIFTCCAGGAVW